MPGDVTFSIKGVREMEQLLFKLGPQVARRVGVAALRAGAKPIADDAKRRVPVDTGALRDSITIVAGRASQASDVSVSDDEAVVYIGFLRPTSARAHLIEFGTRHSPAQPFMRPAMDANHREALDEMAKVLAKGITREAAKLAKPVK